MATGLPTAWTCEVEFTAGVWTDVSGSTGRTPMQIQVGRTDTASNSQPGMLTVVLENIDGRFTPDNPTSIYYPNLIEGKRIRVRVTKGVTSTRFLGYITSISPDITQEPSNSTTTISAVDTLGILESRTLDPAWTAYSKAAAGTRLLNYWPVTDTDSNAGAVDAVGNIPLVVSRTTPTASVNFSNDGSFSPDSGSCATLSGGLILQSSAPLIRSTAATDYRYLSAWVKLSNGASGEVMAASLGRRTGSASFFAATWDGVSTVTSTSGGTVTGISPGWRLITIFWQPSTGLADLQVDNNGTLGSGAFTAPAYDSVSVGGSTATISVRDLRIRTSASLDAGGFDAAEIALAFGPDLLSNQVFALGTILSPIAIAQTTADTRSAAPLSCGSSSILTTLIKMARGSSGVLYHDYATDVVKIVTGPDFRPTSVTLTVDGEADMDGTATFVRNNIKSAGTVTASSASNSVQVTDSAASAATISVDTTLAATIDLFTVASDVISQTRNRKLRASSLTVDLVTAQNDLYASMFAMQPGRRVRMTNLPSTHLGFTYIDGYAEGWLEEIGTEVYRVTFDTSPADSPIEALLDTGRLAWGAANCTASVLTSSGTSVVLTWTGGDALSTAAGDYPMDININGERCTITAAPVGSASPQTVTITRGVAPTVARAHVAGEAVEVWDYAGVGF